MVPVQLYNASATSLRKPQWGLVDTTALSPWNVMTWGLKQIKGVVVGSGSDGPRLQPQVLVLVGNLQVWCLDRSNFFLLFNVDLSIGGWGESSKAGNGCESFEGRSCLFERKLYGKVRDGSRSANRAV